MIRYIPRGIELRHQFEPLPPEDKVQLSIVTAFGAVREPVIKVERDRIMVTSTMGCEVGVCTID